MTEIVDYPRGPYRHLAEEFKDPIRLKFSLKGPSIGFASDDFYRLGGGANLSFPLTKQFHIGAGYGYYPFSTEKTFQGHHFEAFVEAPQKLAWGIFRMGLFSEVASLTSKETFQSKGGLSGIFTGVHLPLLNLGKKSDIQLGVQAGVGPKHGDWGIGTLLLASLELSLKFER